MTASERASAVCSGWLASVPKVWYRLVVEAIDASVAAEREACATLAETMRRRNDECPEWCWRVATAIRARGGKTEGS